MTPSKKCFPPSVGSTFSIFTNFHFIAINMHIAFVIFKNVLPALGGEHIFAIYRLSKLCKNMQIIIAYIFFVFGCVLEPLGVVLRQCWAALVSTRGKFASSWGQHDTNLGQLGPT